MHDNPTLGPGTYDFEYPNKGKSKRGFNAPFRESQRPDNVFGRVPDFPGPTDYHLPGDQSPLNETFKQKQWSTNIQAFGNTEKRFAFSKETSMIAQNVPGAGKYTPKNTWASSSFSTGESGMSSLLSV